MSSARFTDHDRLKPTYCRACHVRIPGLTKGTHGGLCAQCAVSGTRDAKEILERHQRVKEEKRQTLKLHSTGMGECPACHSQNVAEVPKTARNRARTWLFAGSFALLTPAGALFDLFGKELIAPPAILFGTGLALFVAALAQPSKKIVKRLLLCNHCAQQWDGITINLAKNGES